MFACGATDLAAQEHEPVAIAIAAGGGAMVGIAAVALCAVTPCASMFPTGNALYPLAASVVFPAVTTSLLVLFVSLSADPANVVANSVAGGLGAFVGLPLGLIVGAFGGFVYFVLDPAKTDTSFYGNVSMGMLVCALPGVVAGAATAAGVTSSALGDE